VSKLTFKIAKRIIYLRKEIKLSQAALAKKIYLSQSQVARLENGKSPLAESIIENLAKTFHVPEHYFHICSKSTENDAVLENAFVRLLYNDIKTVQQLFEQKPFDYEISQEVKFRLLQVIYFYKKNEFDKGQCISDNYIPLFIKTEDDAKECSTLLKFYYLYMVELNFKENKLDICHQYYQLLLNIVTDKYHQARLHLLMAQASVRNAMLSRSLTEINHTISLLESLDSDFLLSSAYLTKSAIFIRLALYDEALRILEKSEAFNKKINNIDIQASIFQNRASIYTKQKKYEKAMKSYVEAYELVTNSHNQSILLISLIICNNKLKNSSNALKWIKILKAKNLREHERMILRSLECEMKLNEQVFDTSQINVVLNYFEEHNSYVDLKYIYSYLADYYFKQNIHKKAAVYYDKRERLEDEKK